MITKTGSERRTAGARDNQGIESPITRGSGDIFADLDISLSAEERIKIVIAREITRVIVMKGYTQVQAAKMVGTDQAKISRISRGILEGFSAERLMAFLLALGIDVKINTSESSESVGHISVEPALVAAG